MRVALVSWTCLALLMGLIASAGAIGLSRLAPRPEPTPRAVAPSLVSVEGFALLPEGSIWLDPDSGRTTFMPAPGGAIFRRGSLSPWLDESGRAQAVGLLSCRVNDPAPDCMGLARVAFPEGEVIDRVPIDVIPAGVPC